MTSRQGLNEQTTRARDSLVSALRTQGGNSELVAQRARRLLQCKPNDVDRDAWLRTVLPGRRDLGKVLKALRAANGGTPSTGAATTSPSQAGGEDQGGRTPQRRRSPHRRHRRT